MQRITRRTMLRNTALAAASIGPFVHTGRGAAQRPPGADAPGRRPNFLFLLTDDQSYATLGCTGSPFMKTPNIDRMRKGGVLFSNTFVAMSLCAPSRACFLTGQYPFRNGIFNNSIRWNQELQTLPRLLHDAGYATAHIGKFHMDGDDRMHPGYDYWAAQVNQGAYVNPRKNINGRWVDMEGYDTTIVTDQALDFIRQTPDEKPFCVWIGYKACHGPFTPAPGHENDFANMEFKPPASFFADDPGKPRRVRNKAGLRGGAEDNPRRAAKKAAAANAPPGNLEQWAARERNQYRCLMGVEDSVGRLLGALDQRKIADDTIVVLASDNGFFHGEHGLHGKLEAYEEALRVPMMVRYPRMIKAGQSCGRFVSNVDLAPTILDFCGMPAPKQMQGRSWRPLVTGKPNAEWRDSFLYQQYGNDDTPATPVVKALRTDRHKLILNLHPADIEELYDLKADPQEMKNLAADPAHKTTVRDLKTRMLRAMRELDDPAVPAVEATVKA